MGCSNRDKELTEGRENDDHRVAGATAFPSLQRRSTSFYLGLLSRGSQRRGLRPLRSAGPLPSGVHPDLFAREPLSRSLSGCYDTPGSRASFGPAPFA